MKKQQMMYSRFYGKHGTQALDVIEQHSDLYEVYCLTANHRVKELAAQVHKFILLLSSSPMRHFMRSCRICSAMNRTSRSMQVHRLSATSWRLSDPDGACLYGGLLWIGTNHPCHQGPQENLSVNKETLRCGR